MSCAWHQLFPGGDPHVERQTFRTWMELKAKDDELRLASILSGGPGPRGSDMLLYVAEKFGLKYWSRRFHRDW